MRRPTKNIRPTTPVRRRQRLRPEALDAEIAPVSVPRIDHNLPEPLAETEAVSPLPQASSKSKVMSIPEAGRALGLGRNAAYEAAKAGQIPTVPVGRRKKMVPRGWVDRLLEKLIEEALAGGDATIGIALDTPVGSTGVSPALGIINTGSMKKK